MSMLSKRDKRRYLALWNCNRFYDQNKILETMRKRSSELFGQIATEKASIRIIGFEEGQNIIIMSCKLETLENILSTIVFIEPTIVAVGLSGTLKGLRTRIRRDSQELLCAFL
jgi:RNase P/RNase MRP subunit POP5